MIFLVGGRQYQFAEALCEKGSLSRADALKLFSNIRNPETRLVKVVNGLIKYGWCEKQMHERHGACESYVSCVPTDELISIFPSMEVDPRYTAHQDSGQRSYAENVKAV